MINSMLENRKTRYAVIFGIWTAIGLFFSTQIYLLVNVIEKHPFPYLKAIRSTVPDWYIWALLSIVIVRLSRRFRLESGSWRRALPVHLIAAVIFSVIHLVLGVTVLYAFEYASGNKVSWLEKFQFNLFWYFHWDVLTYWAIVAVDHALYYYHSYEERKMTAVQLEAELAKAQLQALKMQLHPHFLFNTLNSISVLINKDVQSAKKMIVRLGDFLRLTLNNSGEEEVMLQQELEFLKTYLEIEKVRFQDRLEVQMEIDVETIDIHVPNLILQPIVENAIRHAIATRASGGRIDIRANRENGFLRLRVEDNGPGISEECGAGIGLQNVRARLRQHYGERFRLELVNRKSGGLAVNLDIPISKEEEFSHR